MGLRFRINLVISLVIVFFCMATAVILIVDHRNSIREEIEAGTKITAQILESMISSAMVYNKTGQQQYAMIMFLRQVGRVRANDIRFFDDNDELLYESPPSNYKKGRWAPRWFSRLVEPEISDYRLNLPIGSIIISPEPSRSIVDSWDQLKNFGWFVLMILFLLNTLVFWLLGRWLSPLSLIVGGLSKIQKGNFEVRLSSSSVPELSAISQTFNKVASALQDSLGQKRLTQLVQARLEEERRAIARELHDELGQSITAIKTIGTAVANRPDTSINSRENIKTIVSVASTIYDGVHGIIRRLRPSSLDHLGLKETLKDAIKQWRNRYSNVNCELIIGEGIDGKSEDINITVYRLVQECLTNIIRHSKASKVKVEVGLDGSKNDYLRVRVEDNGIGLVGWNKKEFTRLGIAGMRERVEALGGNFEISESPNTGGVIVLADLPLKH